MRIRLMVDDLRLSTESGVEFSVDLDRPKRLPRISLIQDGLPLRLPSLMSWHWTPQGNHSVFVYSQSTGRAEIRNHIWDRTGSWSYSDTNMMFTMKPQRVHIRTQTGLQMRFDDILEVECAGKRLPVPQEVVCGWNRRVKTGLFNREGTLEQNLNYASVFLDYSEVNALAVCHDLYTDRTRVLRQNTVRVVAL